MFGIVTSLCKQEDPAFRLHLKTARMLVNRILFSPRSLYMITYTGLAYAGLFASPLFYCFHLIDLVFRSRLLQVSRCCIHALKCDCYTPCEFIQETLSSLRHYAGSLLSAGGLWLLLMYLFAIIAYAKYEPVCESCHFVFYDCCYHAQISIVIPRRRVLQPHRLHRVCA